MIIKLRRSVNAEKNTSSTCDSCGWNPEVSLLTEDVVTLREGYKTYQKTTTVSRLAYNQSVTSRSCERAINSRLGIRARLEPRDKARYIGGSSYDFVVLTIPESWKVVDQRSYGVSRTTSYSVLNFEICPLMSP